MKFHPARGTALRTHVVFTRFAPIGHGGPSEKLRTSDIPKIRKLLRTDMTLTAIASECGVTANTLRYFIRRRRICDIAERDKFIKLKKSLDGLEAIE